MAEDANEPTTRYVQDFPSAACAGATYGTRRTSFDEIRDDQILRGAEIWGPFENDEQWQLMKWLVKNVGHNQAEEFFKLAVVRFYDSAFQEYSLTF